MRDLAQRLRGDMVMAQNREDQAQRAAERAEATAKWNGLCDEHLACLGQFEAAVAALAASLTRMREIATVQSRLDAELRPDAFNQLSFSRFQQAFLDAY
jgi:hypothetical protein